MRDVAEDAVRGDGVPAEKVGEARPRMRNRAWKAWAKALGEKASHKKHEADTVAAIRTVIFLSYLTTNAFIIAGVVRHWDDQKSSQKLAQGHYTCVPHQYNDVRHR